MSSCSIRRPSGRVGRFLSGRLFLLKQKERNLSRRAATATDRPHNTLSQRRRSINLRMLVSAPFRPRSETRSVHAFGFWNRGIHASGSSAVLVQENFCRAPHLERSFGVWPDIPPTGELECDSCCPVIGSVAASSRVGRSVEFQDARGNGMYFRSPTVSVKRPSPESTGCVKKDAKCIEKRTVRNEPLSLFQRLRASMAPNPSCTAVAPTTLWKAKGATTPLSFCAAGYLGPLPFLTSRTRWGPRVPSPSLQRLPNDFEGKPGRFLMRWRRTEIT